MRRYIRCGNITYSVLSCRIDSPRPASGAQRSRSGCALERAQQSSIQNKRLTRQEGRVVGSEESHGADQVGRNRDSLDGLLVGVLSEEFTVRELTLGVWRSGEARRDTVNGDAALRKVGGKSAS